MKVNNPVEILKNKKLDEARDKMIKKYIKYQRKYLDSLPNFLREYPRTFKEVK